MTERTTARHHTRRRERGNAIIEVALMAPWIFFLFVGVIDVGFYCYAAINVENAARGAALLTSMNGSMAANQAAACSSVVHDMLPLRHLASTPFTVTHTCPSGSSLFVDAQAVTPSVDDPTNALHLTDTVVTVQFQMVPMIPIPGILSGTFDMTRTARMRVNNL